ncbi:hypothetical protein BS50DRAFT_680306 [Corynespora cassiicola Philippines]|uniref:Uncharacterized protein n=1 Tax=Corynespora cassiicola Philippines TaxID=1448308 RepID=A0A2T2N9A1_CORCC|nr:hypothetical protein BS50DRAFT_680306 [Corynespora cassiicola Philippines]
MSSPKYPRKPVPSRPLPKTRVGAQSVAVMTSSSSSDSLEPAPLAVTKLIKPFKEDNDKDDPLACERALVDEKIRRDTEIPDAELKIPGSEDGYKVVRNFLYALLTNSKWGIGLSNPSAVRATVFNWMGSGWYLRRCFNSGKLGDICPQTVQNTAREGMTGSVEFIPESIRNMVSLCIQREMRLILERDAPSSIASRASSAYNIKSNLDNSYRNEPGNIQEYNSHRRGHEDSVPEMPFTKRHRQTRSRIPNHWAKPESPRIGSEENLPGVNYRLDNPGSEQFRYIDTSSDALQSRDLNSISPISNGNKVNGKTERKRTFQHMIDRFPTPPNGELKTLRFEDTMPGEPPAIDPNMVGPRSIHLMSKQRTSIPVPMMTSSARPRKRSAMFKGSFSRTGTEPSPCPEDVSIRIVAKAVPVVSSAHRDAAATACRAQLETVPPDSSAKTNPPSTKETARSAKETSRSGKEPVRSTKEPICSAKQPTRPLRPSKQPEDHTSSPFAKDKHPVSPQTLSNPPPHARRLGMIQELELAQSHTAITTPPSRTHPPIHPTVNHHSTNTFPRARPPPSRPSPISNPYASLRNPFQGPRDANPYLPLPTSSDAGTPSATSSSFLGYRSSPEAQMQAAAAGNPQRRISFNFSDHSSEEMVGMLRERVVEERERGVRERGQRVRSAGGEGRRGGGGLRGRVGRVWRRFKGERL